MSLAAWTRQEPGRRPEVPRQPSRRRRLASARLAGASRRNSLKAGPGLTKSTKSLESLLLGIREREGAPRRACMVWLRPRLGLAVSLPGESPHLRALTSWEGRK